MRSLIVDDEPAARSRMRRLLGDHPEVEVVGEACDGIEAIEKIDELRPDLAFLDIQMPGLNGFEVVRLLRHRDPQPLVVFVTGFDQHALQAFEANALAYLLKPVESERLAETLDRAAKICAYQDLRLAERRRVETVAEQSVPTLRHIVGRKRDRLVLVAPGDVLYFSADNGLIKAHTAREAYLVNYQLSDLENALPASVFFRARRSALVNLQRVREIRPDGKSSFVLVMDDDRGTEIAVSERQSARLRREIPGL